MPHQVGLLGKLHSSLFRECRRSMTTSKRVQDRSKKKRVHDLEIVVEKHKILSKILFILETLKQESEQIIPVRSLDQYRRQINLPKPHKFSVFLRKCPKLFELYKDQRGILWCGMTKEAENLLQEEEELIEKNSDKAAEFVTRMLMMSIGKRISLDKIVHFRRDIGLPLDFRSHWVHKYPDYFRVVRPFVPYDEGEYLELVNWKSSWAITELEKKVMGVSKAPEDYVPGFLSLSFPMKFPPNYKKLSKYRVAKAFAAATAIVFGGATLAFGLAASKLELHNADDIRTKGKDIIHPRFDSLKEQLSPFRTWAEDMSKKWHLERGEDYKERPLIKELSKILGAKPSS